MNWQKEMIAAVLVCALLAGCDTSRQEEQVSYDSVSANGIQPLLVGQSVPDVQLQTADGKAFNLKQELAEQPTVLIFYRGGWCPYCNLQLSQLQKIESQLQDLGYQIIAISPDRPEMLNKSKESGGFHINSCLIQR